MPDDPARPLCPMCQRGTAALIATVKDGRMLDIYLCQRCHAQFTTNGRKRFGEVNSSDTEP